MKLKSPFYKNIKNPLLPIFDNSNRFARILYRYNSYRKIFFESAKKGVPILDLLRAQFPFHFSDSETPPIVAIEFTNYCNLKCPYCTSPLGLRERGYMSDNLFAKVINDLKKIKTNRIQLVGNGESTLHPNFEYFITELGKTGKYISIVTNGQWLNKEIPNQILNAKVDLIEISIDMGGKENYENSRINGKYEKLIENLIALKSLKESLNAKTIINIRLMVRPSQQNEYQTELKFWQQYADRVMPQYLTKINNTAYSTDLFTPLQSQNNTYPKCSMPFKHLEIKWTGEVLMCYYTQYQIGNKGLVIGNINSNSILELWNCKIMKQYREAHRKRINSNMPACKGCPGT
jgi:MoaA/NifB/PqqE/SkfB family radical SAM enzyme